MTLATQRGASAPRSLGRGALATLVAGALVHAFAPAASAQVSTTRGWSVGLHLVGSSLTVEGEELDAGGGLGIDAGYGLNRRFTVFLTLDGSVVTGVDVPDVPDVSGEWNMGHVDVGVRYHFANSLSRWVPFLEAALGARAVTVQDVEVDGEEVDVGLRGGTLSIGGGTGYYLREKLALSLGARFTGGQFTERDVGDTTVRGFELEASSGRVLLGITWWP